MPLLPPRLISFACVFLLVSGAPGSAIAQAARRIEPVRVSLPSPLPSGFAANDRIWIDFYPAQGGTGDATPAVVLLHALGEQNNTIMSRFGRYLAERGIAAASMTLPYHMRRYTRGQNPLFHFIAPNVPTAVQALRQSAADARTVVDWLCARPDVDSKRIGVIGVSLGAIVAHVAMGQDERLRAGVAILGGGDLPDLYRRSLLYRILHPGLRRGLTAAEREQVGTVDPLTYAGRNRPRHVLMIEAARDLLVPPTDATELWRALGEPPIRWLDTNHFGPIWASGIIMEWSVAYLNSVWNGGRFPSDFLPPLNAPTLKLGMLFGMDSIVEPALTWQAIPFFERPDHMALLHGDVGWSGRGFFFGLAATVNAFVDLGVGRGFSGHAFRPYASLHVVF